MYCILQWQVYFFYNWSYNINFYQLHGCSIIADVELLGYKPVAKMPYILLGYLTLRPKCLTAIPVTGTLYVEDNLIAIVCEVFISIPLHSVILTNYGRNVLWHLVVIVHCI